MSQDTSNSNVLPGPAGPRMEPNLVDQVAAVARRQPDATAAIVGGTPISWSELERKSNTVAVRLHERFGAGPEPLAVVAARGPDGLVTLLGILKSGRPFTWVDTKAPPARIKQVLDLAGSPGALTGPDAGQLLGGGLQEATVPIADLAGSEAVDRPAVDIGPGDPANIVFTSGSTGVPKGVVTSHGYYLSQIGAYARRGFSGRDRAGLVLPVSFAYGAITLFRSLGLGATVDIVDLTTDDKPTSLGQWVKDHGIEVMDMTPSLLRSLVRTLGPSEILESLRIVEVGGEPLFARDVADLRKHVSDGCQIRNIIGASEVGIFASYTVPSGDGYTSGVVPVGAPDPDRAVTVVNAEGQEVPPGETGEIWVTSCYLASGYWRQPELTAERYFDAGQGRTTYRTGDLGRILTDGSLLHLGRADRMVKVRGYLVEPAEIEAALHDTGLVHEAVVLTGADDAGHTTVTAYVVPVDDVRSSPTAIRRAMLERVPEHFIPNRLIPMSELPRNANDKIDTAALSARPVAESGFVAPRSTWERAVAEVWTEVLGVESVGVEDDFFSCGGDSLAVEELIAAMAQKFGMTIKSADLVESPTLSAFAERSKRSNTRRGVIVPLQSEGNAPPLFFLAGGGGPAGVFLMVARHLGPDRPVYGLHAQGIEGGGVPDWSVRRWAARCAREIRMVQPHGPYHLAGHSLGGMVAWEVAHQLRAEGEEVALLAVIDTIYPWREDQLPPGHTSTVEPPDRHLSPLDQMRRLRRAALDAAHISMAGLYPRERKNQIDLFYRHGQIVARRYRPRPWDGPTIVYKAQTLAPGDRRFDWEPLLAGPWEEHWLPGNHNTVLAEPNAAQLADHLAPRLSDPRLVGAPESAQQSDRSGLAG